MKFAIIVFPGSNCDHDAFYALKNMGYKVKFVWHKMNNLDNFDGVVIPGGFSYGDYLRTGAIAKFSPIMNSVLDHSKKGKIIIGICNGFQILIEAGLLPGALITNKNIKFISTGLNTLTGERLLKAKKFLEMEENFMVTYGDGLSSVNLKRLLKFHLKHNKVATVTTVRPPARFGEIYLKKYATGKLGTHQSCKLLD